MTDAHLALLFDFYELTMSRGLFLNDMHEKECYFDVFFRSIPDSGGFVIMAGLEHVLKFIETLNFNKDDIDYLKSLNQFDDEFLSYLESFSPTITIYSVKEGTPVFPNEPIMRFYGKAIDCLLLETAVLVMINHESLIATKTNRIVRAAQGRAILEFGARRAHGVSSAVWGARAAYIAGSAGTSNTLAGKMFKIPALGTMAHSWVQLFPSELEAFRAYAKAYPQNTVLLVDTINVLKSGVPNAIKVFHELKSELKETWKNGTYGIRIDSGDIAYLSQEARRMLDEANLPEIKISVSNSLDEYIIQDLIAQGASIDSFGVGERLIVSESCPVLGCVYKLSATIEDGKQIPKIKISENVDKITTPCAKKLYRYFDKESKKAIADEVCLIDETVDESKERVLFHERFTWKKKVISNFCAVELLEKVMENGKRTQKELDIEEIKAYCKEQVSLLWDEMMRFNHPHKYYVDLSQSLWEKKRSLLEETSKERRGE